MDITGIDHFVLEEFDVDEENLFLFTKIKQLFYVPLKSIESSTDTLSTKRAATPVSAHRFNLKGIRPLTVSCGPHHLAALVPKLIAPPLLPFSPS